MLSLKLVLANFFPVFYRLWEDSFPEEVKLELACKWLDHDIQKQQYQLEQKLAQLMDSNTPIEPLLAPEVHDEWMRQVWHMIASDLDVPTSLCQAQGCYGYAVAIEPSTETLFINGTTTVLPMTDDAEQQLFCVHFYQAMWSPSMGTLWPVDRQLENTMGQTHMPAAEAAELYAKTLGYLFDRFSTPMEDFPKRQRLQPAE